LMKSEKSFPVSASRWAGRVVSTTFFIFGLTFVKIGIFCKALH